MLSDFEGLRVFNAEWKESNPFSAQFIEFGLDDYLKDFERLWWLSRPETLARRLDSEAEKVGKKVKRLPVSQHLFDLNAPCAVSGAGFTGERRRGRQLEHGLRGARHDLRHFVNTASS